MSRMNAGVAAASIAAFAALAPMAGAQSGSWSYAYDTASSTGTATMRDSDGDVAATISCRAPNGELVITSYELRGGDRATIRAGTYSQSVNARSERGQHGRGLVISLRQSPPVLAAARPNTTISIEAGRRTHTLAAGAAEKMWEVVYSCWQAPQA